MLIGLGVSIGIGLLCAALSLFTKEDSKLLWAIVLFVLGSFMSFEIETLLQLERIGSAVDAQRELTEIADPVLRRQAIVMQGELATQVSDLQHGKVELDGEKKMMEAYYAVFEMEPKGAEIRAVSLVNIPLVWGRALGERALRANKEAIARGVKVSRVFVFRTAAQRAASQEYLTVQKNAGVNVLFADAAALNPGLSRDFLVTSSGTALEFSIDDQGALLHAVLERSSSRLDEYRGTMDQIMAVAKSFR